MTPAANRQLTGYQKAIELVREPLAELGFKKRAGGVFTAQLTDATIGVVSLARAVEGMPAGQALVYPAIGVRHQPLERIVARLLSEKFHPYEPATITTPVGSLMPDHGFTQWLIGSEDSEDQAESMLRAIRDYGLPFMRSHADLGAIREAMEADYRFPLEYKLPVALWLLGDHEAARQTVEDHLAELGDAENPYAERYRSYAANFRAHENELDALAG